MSISMEPQKPRSILPAAMEMSTKALDSAGDAFEKIPSKILQGCKGVAILSSMEIAFMISGGGGSGVVVKRNEDGSWSPPIALQVNTVGAGFNFGAGENCTLLFPMSDKALEDLTKDTFKGGLNLGAALGPLGREAEVGASPHAVYAYSVQQGMVIKCGINSAKISQDPQSNQIYYGSDASPTDIVFTPGSVTIPSGQEGKFVEDLHQKLSKVAA